MLKLPELPPRLQYAADWATYTATRFSADQCTRSAAALTYMSLFALVPLMTVMYAMVSAIPAFQGVGEQAQGFLFDNLVPSTGAEVENYLSDFSTQAKNLTGVGIGFLVVTAVLMLRNIESSFNVIWRTRKNRSAISSFLLYWAVLSLGPIFIGLTLGISTYLVSAALFFEDYDIIGIGSVLLKAAPLLLSTAAFTLLYAAVPNCRVPMKHALIGGLVTAIVFNIARSLFTKLVVGSSYTVIYGAFAAFPLFLLWIYVSWNIVLGGGIIVHSLSAFRGVEAGRRPILLKALGILHAFWGKQKHGGSLNELSLLASNNIDARGVDSESWQRLRDVFLRHNVLAIDERGHYLLARDLSKITLWQLKEWLLTEVEMETLQSAAEHGWQGRARDLLLDQRHSQRELLNISLAELFEAEA